MRSSGLMSIIGRKVLFLWGILLLLCLLSLVFLLFLFYGLFDLALPSALHLLSELGKVVYLLDLSLPHVLQILVVFRYVRYHDFNYSQHKRQKLSSHQKLYKLTKKLFSKKPDLPICFVLWSSRKFRWLVIIWRHMGQFFFLRSILRKSAKLKGYLLTFA